MSNGINKVILIGNVGMVEVKERVTRVSLATSDSYKDKNSGETVQLTEWHRLVFFGKLAEIAGKYLTKGSKIYVEGAVKYGKYTDNQGVERHTTDIMVRNMQMLANKDKDTRPPGGPSGRREADYDFIDDEIPDFA